MLIYNKKSNILFYQIPVNQYLYGVKQKHYNMLPSKDTTILSEINNFFTSSEKAIETVFSTLGSLKLSESQFFIKEKPNNTYKDTDKLLLMLLFPLFKIKSGYEYKTSVLYSIVLCGKDVFYRLLNNPNINWRKLHYSISKKLIKQTASKTEPRDTPSCLIIDDTDLPKTGRCIELIGKIYTHVSHRSILAFKGLFMAYHDGKSLFALDFSLHGEQGKNKKRPYGISLSQSKKRYSKQRAKKSCGKQRTQEYTVSKIKQMIVMIRTAIAQGIRFDYLLVDSWFTCYELVEFITTRRIKCHLLGMIKMGNTGYIYNEKIVSAKQLVDTLRRNKKVKRSKTTRFYYCEAIVFIQNIEVKIFFSKTSKRAKWHGLLTTNTALSFDKAYKTYATRWTIEVFFKESKQFLGLGKCESQDFDAQIAHTTLCMLQYNILTTVKRFDKYETFGVLFRQVQKESLEKTINERIWLIILDIVAQLAVIFEADTEIIMEKLITDNQIIKKYLNFQPYIKAA